MYVWQTFVLFVGNEDRVDRSQFMGDCDTILNIAILPKGPHWSQLCNTYQCTYYAIHGDLYPFLHFLGEVLVRVQSEHKRGCDEDYKVTILC